MSSFTASPIEVSASSSSSDSFMSSVTSFFSSFAPTVYAEEEESGDSDEGKSEEDSSEGGEEESSEDAGEGEEAEEEEEEEEEEPEDPYPAIYEACEQSKPCAKAKHHFDECTERVTAGDVHFKGEDCAEEFPPRSLRQRMCSTKDFQQARLNLSAYRWPYLASTLDKSRREFVTHVLNIVSPPTNFK
ncbi:unnamed protein product [Sympodiomycopsis kandeliae]